MTMTGDRTLAGAGSTSSRVANESEAAIIGRDDELAAVDTFLADPVARTLVLEGPAGIGKTSLWLAACERARRCGRHVLCARPVAVERYLSFAVLGDLLADVPERCWELLPELHRRVLAAALSREEAGSLPGPSSALGVAVLGLLQAHAADEPLLLAVDDLHWADEASMPVLVYALRRLGDADVRSVVSCRVEPGTSLPFGLEQAIDESSLTRLALGPMSEGAIRRLLSKRLGLTLTRSELHALYAASGGNPFFAIELGRAGVDPDEFGFVHVPDRLIEFVGAQLDALPVAARETLLVVAATAEATAPLLARADADDGLEAALAAGVIQVDRGRIRPTHPLLASAAWNNVDPDRRRAIHRVLAEAVEDTEERACHLAAATDPPNEEVSALLEAAAAAAQRRGAPAAAADLLERSLSFAPSDDLERWACLGERLTAAHAEAGHWERVSELVREAQQRLPAGPRRAAILVTAAELQPGLDELLRQAIGEAGESSLALRARIGLALQAALSGRWEESVRIADETASLARRTGERALLGVALTFGGGLRLLDSRLDGRDQLDEALAIEAELGGLPTSVFESPRMWKASALLWGGDPLAAREIFNELLALASVRGDDMSMFQVRQLLGLLELRAGDWCAARAAGRAALEQVELIGYEYGRPILGGLLASIDAHEGKLVSARAFGSDAVAALDASGDRLWSTYAHAALLLAELSAGDVFTALEHVEAIEARFPDGRECWWSYHQGDELEALVLAGEHDRARIRAGSLRESGRRLELPRFLAWAARGEALLATAQGDLPAAVRKLETALAFHERFLHPFERARTLLVYGQVLRRANRRRAARASLGEALAEFERLGACRFATATREELKHVSGRIAAGPHTLTGAEEHVSHLVAEGLSNKEVAARLYVTVSTVEAALTRSYRKLGITSRSQLARALDDDECRD